MRVTGFIWLEAVVQKLIWKHSVQTDEVAELFQNRPRIQFVEKGHRKDENVYSALGKTDAGRFLTCYFINKPDGRALVLSARDMSKTEKRLYGKK